MKEKKKNYKPPPGKVDFKLKEKREGRNRKPKKD
jgi:hypothetical protein